MLYQTVFLSSGWFHLRNPGFLTNGHGWYSKDFKRSSSCSLIADFGSQSMLISERLYGQFYYSRPMIKDMARLFPRYTLWQITFIYQYTPIDAMTIIVNKFFFSNSNFVSYYGSYYFNFNCNKVIQITLTHLNTILNIVRIQIFFPGVGGGVVSQAYL